VILPFYYGLKNPNSKKQNLNIKGDLNMINWEYNPEQYDENHNIVLEKGEYRVRINKVENTTACTGTPGLEITFDVSGRSNKLRHYIWFNSNNRSQTNQLLGEFFNSFGIDIKDCQNHEAWIGKIGAVYVERCEYKGRTSCRVKYCIKSNHQSNIPEWQEPPSKRKASADFGEALKVPCDMPVKTDNCKPKVYAGLSF